MECFHPFCIKCFYKLAEDNISSIKCSKCKNEVTENFKSEILGPDYEKFEKIVIDKLMGGNLLICANLSCKEMICFEKGKPDYNIKDDKGNILSKIAAEHYSEKRCRCSKCNKDFCVECKAEPYHLGIYTYYKN